jgi:hypothetical protein
MSRDAVFRRETLLPGGKITEEKNEWDIVKYW